MRDATELDELSIAVRKKQVPVDSGLLALIEAEVEGYREEYGKALGGDLADALEPPAELWDPLWSTGWLIYEASLKVTEQIKPHDRSEHATRMSELARRLYAASVALPWPHFAPRALGATRAFALVASKENTALGFAEAQDLHKDARNRHQDFTDTHGRMSNRDLFKTGLDEMLLQLVLAETGTTCRAAERTISRWAEGMSGPEPEWLAEEEEHYAQLMFGQLLVGVRIGGVALDTAAEIEKRYGFVDEPTSRRMAMPTAFRNPGIMTARAALLTLALSWELEHLQTVPRAEEYEDWAEFRDAITDDFLSAYRAIERPVTDEKGESVPLSEQHRRSLVQIRLNAAVLLPGYDLPSELDFHPCLAINPLDDAAVEALSAWLAEDVDGKGRRGDANVIGSSTMPLFNTGVRASRAAAERRGGYEKWRLDWFELDRHSGDEGRREIVEQVLRRDDGTSQRV